MGPLLSQEVWYSVMHLTQRLVYMSSFSLYFTEIIFFILNSALP